MPPKQTKTILYDLATKDWTLSDIFYLKLLEIHDLEIQMIKLVPKMIAKANSPKLKKLFQSHQKETVLQLERAKKAFDIYNKKIEIIPNLSARGLVAEAEFRMGLIRGKEATDASLVASAMSIGHYEMYCYMVAIEWAQLLGETKISKLLTESFSEEKEMEHNLFKLVIGVYSQLKDR